MTLSSAISNHKLKAAAVLLALSTAACTQQQPTQAAAPETKPAADETATATANAAPDNLATFSALNVTLPTEAASKECALDALDGQLPTANSSIVAGASAALGGWAGNGAGQTSSKLQLILKGESQSYSTPIVKWVGRQDVAASLKAPGLAQSGFEINISLKDVVPGNYALYIADPDNATTTLCDLHHAFNLK